MNKFKQFLVDLANGDMKKSELKNFIHANGFFSQAKMNLLSREEAQSSLTNKRSDKAVTITDGIPEGESIYIYEGIISQQYGKGEKNRNGYKIDKNGWKLDEYMYNPAILLMHDPEKGVIGNMVKVGVTNQGLKGLFWVDINNISDEGIKNQIKTGTLKASSTGSLVDEYMLEDVTTGKNYTEEKATELYGDREVIKAFRGMDGQLILNITSSIMLETSLVTLGSNYKAVSDTIGKYFSNIINNRMTPEELAALEAKKNAVDTSTETQEGETPEGETTTTTTTTSENDVETTPVTTTEETTENEETTEDVPENDTTTEETPEAKTTTGEETTVSTEDALKKENEELKNKIADLENQINTPVLNTSLSKDVQDKATPVQLTAEQTSKNFMQNVVWKAKS